MVELYSRKIEIESVINFRDLGGYRNHDGNTVAWRRIFRSGNFRNITPDDYARIEKEIGLTTVIDLRSSEETEQQGKWHFREAGIRYHHIPFPGGGGNKKEEARVLNECTNLGDFYLYIINRKEFKKQIIDALKVIADPKNHPLVFHCAIGKDRTGILSAILLSILGIDDAVIIEDYTLSGPAVEKLRETMSQSPTDREFVNRFPVHFWKAAPESMALFLSSLKKQNGSIVGYLINLGVDTYLIEGIRKSLLT
jgi:protein-tyrosine phosphatase